MSKIDAIKNETDFARILARECGGLRSSGRGYFLGYCPFCQPEGKAKGRRPTFWYDSTRGLCNCFKPRCKSPKPMDVINYTARRRGISLSEAIDQLSEAVQ